MLCLPNITKAERLSKVKLLWSRHQVHLRNSGTRSVRLDAWEGDPYQCGNGKGKPCGIPRKPCGGGDGGEEEFFPRVSGKIRYLKEEQKGAEEMCEAVEEYARESRTRGKGSGIKVLFCYRQGTEQKRQLPFATKSGILCSVNEKKRKGVVSV